MKNILLIVLAVSTLTFLTGCGDDVQENDVPAVGTQTTDVAPTAQEVAPAPMISGTVLETMNSGGYSYVQIDTGTEQVWAAGPERDGLAVGQQVSFPDGMVMNNFTAKSLDRTFPKILFVGAINLAGETVPSSGHGGMMGMDGAGTAPTASNNTVVATAGVENVAKLDGGHTVAEIYARAAELGGKTIKVRARVVKFTPNIMSTNWVHIQDGTGEAGSNDLTVTTSGHVAAGDLVVVEGPLSVDKDFGAGYKYHVIIEGAKVTKE